MNIALVRFSYSPTETEGMLFAPPLEPMWTMEQPWRRGGRGGLPFKSCVPDGEYRLVPFLRDNGQQVWALENHDLGVYVKREDRERDDDRFACLIHPGNVVSHSVGCVLPGISRGFLKGERAVLRSGFRNGYALNMLTRLLGRSEHTITISQVEGAK